MPLSRLSHKPSRCALPDSLPHSAGWLENGLRNDLGSHELKADECSMERGLCPLPVLLSRNIQNRLLILNKI